MLSRYVRLNLQTRRDQSLFVADDAGAKVAICGRSLIDGDSASERSARSWNVDRCRRPRLNRNRLRPQVVGLEPQLLLAAPGDLDNSFNGDRVRQLDFTPSGADTSSQRASAVAIDPSGNIVIAGSDSTDTYGDTGEVATVGRLQPLGNSDSASTATGCKCSMTTKLTQKDMIMPLMSLRYRAQQ